MVASALFPDGKDFFHGNLLMFLAILFLLGVIHKGCSVFSDPSLPLSSLKDPLQRRLFVSMYFAGRTKSEPYLHRISPSLQSQIDEANRNQFPDKSQ